MIKKKTKFLRLGYSQYSKLGLRRKKKQKYRKAKGIDNKVRLKMKGHLQNVNIGFRNKKSERGLIKGLKPVHVKNISDIERLKKEEIGILAKVGSKNKKEIADYLLKNNLKLLNFNPKIFLEKLEAELKEKQEKKKSKEEKIKEKEKKLKENEKKEEKKEDKKGLEENIENKENKENESKN